MPARRCAGSNTAERVSGVASYLRMEGFVSSTEQTRLEATMLKTLMMSAAVYLTVPELPSPATERGCYLE